MQDILLEVDAIKKKSQKCVNELKGLSNFFKIFTRTYQEEAEIFEKRLSEHEEKYKFIDDSILSANLLGIYDCFRQYNKNTQNLMTKITNELISPYEMFRNTQFSIYQNNINELRDLNKIYLENKKLLDISKQNYYQAEDNILKENQQKKLLYTKEQSNNYDIYIQSIMKAKNYEMIYKYEIDKYNKNIGDINKRYDNIHNKIEIADQSRIMFIKTSFDKYRSYMEDYIKNIKDFLNIIENYISDDICNKDQKHNLKEFTKFKENKKLKTEKFISFNEYIEKEKTLKKEKIEVKDLKIINSEEEEIIDFIKNLINELFSENEVPGHQMAKLIELFQYKNQNSDIEKKIYGFYIREKEGIINCIL